MDEEFQAWMRKLDELFIHRTGMSIHDMPDQTFRDWFDDDMSPEEAVEEMLEDAFGDLLCI